MLILRFLSKVGIDTLPSDSLLRLQALGNLVLVLSLLGPPVGLEMHCHPDLEKS